MPEKECAAEIEFDGKKIRVEGPESFVADMIARYSRGGEWERKRAGDSNNAVADASTASIERKLISDKRPSGHHEIVAVLAFALTESGMAVFTEQDIKRAYIRAGVRPPKVVAQALRDAKNKYDYFELAGERGQYRLTNHGERVVRFDLPRDKEQIR